MDTADVDPAAIALPREKRYTTHLFLPGDTFLLGGLGAPPSGTPIQISDSPDWPPTILFDAVYASVVLQHFGTQTLKDVVSSTWDKVFYPSGVVNRAHADYYTEEWKEKQRRKDEEALSRPDTFDMLLAIPYAFADQDKVDAYFRKVEQRAEQAEQRRAQDKVTAWLRQVHAYTSWLTHTGNHTHLALLYV